jgi:imidazole glycerol-phosphate synthase subunit HisH
MLVVIVDYGMGNLRSINYKLEKFKVNSIISSKKEDIEKADRLILPGVGHFAQGMKNLEAYGLISVLNEKVLDHKTPILGICLGVQLFTKSSEEGFASGLGWIDAETKRFNFTGYPEQWRIPHVGWDTIDLKRPHPVMAAVAPDQTFYFTHSYHLCCNDPQDVVATTRYGYDFVSVVGRGNICGTQFHPEKSHARGFEIVRRFVEGE